MGKSYRVFISYSHHDSDLVDRIERVLRDNGLVPMRDKSFAFGSGFDQQIRTYIAHAHVFLPFITENSTRRNWVQQEIGYAMALNVPVLPMVLGALPEGMPSLLHALTYPDDESELRSRLSAETFANLVTRFCDAGLAPYHCAELAEDRAIFMTRYANEVIDLGYYGMVRQKGGLSSFHIPDNNLSAPIWTIRYGTKPKSRYHCRELRKERVALGAHARQKGFRIIVNPDFKYFEFGDEARRARLQTLLDFLEALPEETEGCRHEIVFDPDLNSIENTTIVGDWFAAESVSRVDGAGYRQTAFTTHAPSMRSRIELFDLEFDDLLKTAKWKREESRHLAVEGLKQCLRRRGGRAGTRGRRAVGKRASRKRSTETTVDS